MKRKRNQLLIMIIVAGFFVGFYYAWEIKLKVFDEITIKYWETYNLVYKDYFLYLARERMTWLLLIVFLGNVKYTHIYGGVVTFCIGICGGSLFMAAGMQLGIKGYLMCLIILFPHIVFYGMVYVILIKYWVWKTRWTKTKTLGTILLMGMGILCETYISPFLIKLFL